MLARKHDPAVDLAEIIVVLRPRRLRPIAGAAQRRTRDGLLIQGSVQPSPIDLQRSGWENAMRETATDANDVEWNNFTPDKLMTERVEFLAAQKYSQAAYNRKR